ncbi:MAG: HmuY family protein [Imperialibacter sp.]|uniref:HmuY family protein n=1 Tax=Imperialibacter sp. TaxID=2038411 RepID=UPI0032EFB35A
MISNIRQNLYGVYEDRFYIIKDASGNYYKLKFTALMQTGERGKPQIASELLG